MRALLLLLVCVLLMATGCVSKSAARKQQAEAFQAGQRQMQMQAATANSVTILGNVQNHLIPWSEELTLTHAIDAAHYLGRGDPTAIIVVRRGQPFPVNLRRLLNGLENPPLEPGDVVDIRR